MSQELRITHQPLQISPQKEETANICVEVLLKNISLVGIHWGAYTKFERETIPVVWKGIGDLIAEGKFKGTVFSDKEFVGLERIPDALLALGSRETWGKVVVKIPQSGESKL